MSKKALIAMSGGVDSSAAAAFIKEQGYDCIGATMILTDYSDEKDVLDAKTNSEKLGMDHIVFNFVDKFDKTVVSDFIASYEKGYTPNPCIICNKYLKFGALLEEAEKLGCSKLVTGHYAQIEFDEYDNRWKLKRANNKSKDQSYVLWFMSQEQLSKTLFPLGGFSDKDEVRAYAAKKGFVNSSKHDSQDICFVPDGDYAGFIERKTSKTYPTGNFTDKSGKILGRHKGIIHYTIGQRKGLGLSLPAPLYVCQKDPVTNNVILTPEEELFTSELTADNFNWLSIPEPTSKIHVMAKPRYRAKEAPATAEVLEDKKVRIIFDEPQRAITKGQSVVLYDKDYVLGGGIII